MFDVLAAERESRFGQQLCLGMTQRSEVVSLVDLPEDELLRQSTNQMIRGIGHAALVGAEIKQYEANDSLLSAIKRGAAGDTEAQAMVATNVGSDFSERVIKAGEVTKYHLDKDEAGQLMQYGQSYMDIYTNTLKLTPLDSKMRQRTEAETRNAYRIQYWYDQGLLEDNCMVVFSPCADDMSDEELNESGFFAETKTMAIQATYADEDRLAIESGFVAGVAQPGAERHDFNAVVKLAEALGVDYSCLTANEIIDTPLLIPKSLMPRGVVDLVEMYDDHAGGTFFGESRPRQDYLAYRDFCDQRRQQFAGDIRVVTEQLLREAPTINTPIQAIKRLDKLSEAQMVKKAIKDRSINVRVFGAESAHYIEYARQQAEIGNYGAVKSAEVIAIRTATSSSCPSGVSRQSRFDQEAFDGLQEGSGNKDEGEDKYGPLTFKCPKGHTNRRPRNKLISNCKTCGTSVKC